MHATISSISVASSDSKSGCPFSATTRSAEMLAALSIFLGTYAADFLLSPSSALIACRRTVVVLRRAPLPAAAGGADGGAAGAGAFAAAGAADFAALTGDGGALPTS